MPSLFSRIRGKDGQGKSKSKKNANPESLTHQLPNQPRWENAYARTTIEPEEVQELIRRCTEEIKSRALDQPFLLLPFRPTSDPSAVRTFVRHFFDGNQNTRGDALVQELRMTEPMVIAGVLKWCWSRIQGGLVGWDAYELFKVGEQDSSWARNSFTTFIPLSVDNDARSDIIFDYFDLLSAMAAHGKTNGFGGRKLSRMASWWAFEHKDTGNGFDGGYEAWMSAADATSHLFFAYLRSMTPQQPRSGISMLPMSLQKLLEETEYPPETPSLMMSSTNIVVMIVDTVSPTPFALLRRASHFQYRDDDQALRDFSEYEDPVMALTEECGRVLKAISAANQSQVSSSKHSTGLRDASWSRFEDIGFGGALDEDEDDESTRLNQARNPRGLRTTPASGTDMGRPTTPSWADFLSSGFVDDSPNSPSNHLLPPDKILPPIETNIRQRSSQSHNPRLESNRHVEPGELASITRFELDDAFWWVWMSSLAPEETAERKSAFGRCAVIETVIRSGRWLVMEEKVKGAAPEPDAGAYIAEKKSFFSWTRRNRDKGVSRSKSNGKEAFDRNDRLSPSATSGAGLSKTSIGPDQQAKIQAAAQQLHAKQAQEQLPSPLPERRGRSDAELMREKTSSVLTLQPVIVKEASPAMKWANKYDKESIRTAYLGNMTAGRGLGQLLEASRSNDGASTNGGLANGNGYRPDAPESSMSKPSQSSPALAQPPAVSEARSPITPSSRQQEFLPVPERKPVNGHPAEKSGPTGRDSPLPPPPREQESIHAARENMTSPELPVLTPAESRKQHKKLQKDEKKAGGGGFRKLFGRNKNRQSKVPDNAATDVNAFLTADPPRTAEPARAPSPEPEPQPQRPQPVASESAVMSPPDEEFATPMELPGEKTPTQTQPTPTVREPAYEPSGEDAMSRIDTADAREASHEFSRFDQGPLSDQPAFIPNDDQSDDDATPPPIARHASSNPPVEEDIADEEGAPSPAVPMQDRWAAIRKNAAERAARQSEEKSHGAYSKTTDGDDDTSGEETIESRVARIKARVAELTGNMEGSGSPGTQTPPAARR
ncbi:Uu.00g027990.m01.CDS01 [Anthostomella pinea]|uniref:Uu.00g027990.m01.CDS01 n=1 Tax=Anthostomella pinea TaxID=933095 RepID=A0AAI8V8U9_9PEZI|nr:Uu.00g027990.m01.CDS01 [Anthostomella pinea]